MRLHHVTVQAVRMLREHKFTYLLTYLLTYAKIWYDGALWVRGKSRTTDVSSGNAALFVTFSSLSITAVH